LGLFTKDAAETAGEVTEVLELEMAQRIQIMRRLIQTTHNIWHIHAFVA
jgi:hypothetical protein